MKISETKFRPTPPDASALELRVVQSGEQRGYGQFSIENGEGSLGGEWDRYYVDLSGYFGEHNPAVFAAAPELYEALQNAIVALAMCTPNTQYGAACQSAAMLGGRAALAKARGAA